MKPDTIFNIGELFIKDYLEWICTGKN